MKPFRHDFGLFFPSASTAHDLNGRGCRQRERRTGWMMITSRVLGTAGTLFAGGTIAILTGRARERFKARRMVETLEESSIPSVSNTVEPGLLSELPSPVARYFRYALSDGQPVVRVARIQQSGVLRTDTATAKWSTFTATQTVVPPATGFVWNARVGMPFGTSVRVIDSYIAGVGSGRVSLLSAFVVASEAGGPELNSGALHRYLAEGVWCPTALLPQAGVVWSPIDDNSALATLTDIGTSVSLEFRFNNAGEATGIYSAGRFGSFGGEYRKVPWQGHFGGYEKRAGMRVPRYGEVGWHEGGGLQLVWKGHITHAQYQFEP